MNLEKLKSKLLEENIPEDSYSLQGGLPNDRYCLEKTSYGWNVYYSERGSQTELEFYESEEKACTDILNRLLRLKKYL